MDAELLDFGRVDKRKGAHACLKCTRAEQPKAPILQKLALPLLELTWTFISPEIRQLAGRHLLASS